MKKTILIFAALFACICLTGCGVKTGTVKLTIDDDVKISKLIIAKSTSNGYQNYSELDVDYKQGDTFERTMAKGGYCFFMKAEGGPTYTKDNHKLYKIDYQHCMLPFEILDGEVTEVNFSQMTPNVAYYKK